MDSTIGNVPEILLGFLTEAAGGEGLPPQKKLLHSIDVIEKKVMEELQKLKTSSAAMEADRRNTIQILMYELGFFPNDSDYRCRHAKLPGPPTPVEEVLQKIQQLTSYNYNSNKFFHQRNAGFAQQGERPQVPQGSNAVSQGFAGKPSMVESANVQRPQQQVQPSQQPVGQNQIQNVSNGLPNQANRTVAPLPPGISRCVQSPKVFY